MRGRVCRVEERKVEMREGVFSRGAVCRMHTQTARSNEADESRDWPHDTCASKFHQRCGHFGTCLERAKTSPWIEYSHTGGDIANRTVAATIETPVRIVNRRARTTML